MEFLMKFSEIGIIGRDLILVNIQLILSQDLDLDLGKRDKVHIAIADIFSPVNTLNKNGSKIVNG